MRHGLILRRFAGGCVFGVVMVALMTMLLVLLTGCLTTDQYERTYREILAELATTTTTTTTTTTSTTLPPAGTLGPVAGAPLVLMADGRRLSVCFADDSEVGKDFGGTPDIVAMRPSDGNYKLGQQGQWVALCKDVRARFPAARLAWCGNGGSHPILFRLIADHRQKVDLWLMDCEGMTERGVAGDVSKLTNEYAIRRGLGFRIVVFGTPHTAAALKAGAVGVLE